MVNGVQHLLVSIYRLSHGPADPIHIETLSVASVAPCLANYDTKRTLNEQFECGSLKSHTEPIYAANNWLSIHTRRRAVETQVPMS